MMILPTRRQKLLSSTRRKKKELKMDTRSTGSLILWPHAMITSDGTIVTLISRDCCPYIDDPEPDYVNSAVVATQDTEKRDGRFFGAS